MIIVQKSNNSYRKSKKHIYDKSQLHLIGKQMLSFNQEDLIKKNVI